MTILTPFGAGSATDAAARLIGQLLQEAMGQTFVIENKPGASGVIGNDFVAHATPDGYTLLLATSATQVISSQVIARLPYDPLRDPFQGR